MSNDFRDPGENVRGPNQLQKPTPAHPNDARKLTPRCRVGSLEFKLQLVRSKTDNPQG